MIKSLVNKYLKAALSELFTDAGKDSVQLSMGADLFASSNINLKNLTFRPDIFDAVLHPIRLVSGHLGRLNVEGIAELAIGGKLRIQFDSINLLFAVDSNADASRVQFLKKIMVELQTADLQQSLVREILRRIQGFSGGKDPDFKKKRVLFLRIINLMFRNIEVTVRALHIRIEVPCRGMKDSSLYCSAVGVTVPLFKVIPNVGIRPDGVSRDDPILTMSLKSMQVYCDYDCESYTANGDSPAMVLSQFVDRWKCEVHSAFLLPFDMDIVFAAEIRRRSGIFSPKIVVNIPKFRIACDPRQLEVLKDLLELMVVASKRAEHLLQVSNVFGQLDSPDTPRLFQVGGTHLLPYLAVGNKRFPTTMNAPRAENVRLVSLFKTTWGPKWKRALWKHLIKVVLNDLRATRPLGKWILLAKLAFIRKDYAFTYSRLIKRSRETGNLVYNVNARVDPAIVGKLFEYEMILPIGAIKLFRSLACMIVIVELFNGKRRQVKAGGGGGPGGGAFERICIGWWDILMIQSELFEAQQESAIKRFTKSYSGMPDDDDNNNLEDDGQSTHSGNSNTNLGSVYCDSPTSVYSFSTFSNVPATPNAASRLSSASPAVGNRPPATILGTGGGGIAGSISNISTANLSSHGSTVSTPSASGTSSAATTTPAKASFSSIFSRMVGNTPNGNNSTAPGNTIMTSSARKMFNTVKQAASIPTDALDSKLFGNAGMSAFGDFLGKVDREEEYGVGDLSTNEIIDEVSLEVFDWNLDGDPPTFASIVEGVQWGMMRYQAPITAVLPDFEIVVTETEASFRQPLEDGHRKNILSGTIENVVGKVTISGATSSLPPSSSSALNDAANSPVAKTASGLISLAGALVQLRLTVQSFVVALHVEDVQLAATMNGIKTPKLRDLSKPNTTPLLKMRPESPGEVNVSVNPVEEFPENDLRMDEEDEDEEEDEENEDDEDDEGGTDEDASMKEYYGKLRDYKEAQEAVAAKAAAIGAGRGLTVLQSLQLAQEEETKKIEAAKARQKELHSVPIIASVKGQGVLTICIILDFDEKSEGAADVQIQVGNMRVDCGGGLLTAIMDVTTTDNCVRAMTALKEAGQWSAAKQEKSVVIDQQLNMNSPIGMSNNGHNSAYLSREVIMENMNFQNWYHIVQGFVPRAVTVCMRVSPLAADFFSAATMKNAMLTKMKTIIDNASLRAGNSGSTGNNSSSNRNSKRHSVRGGASRTGTTPSKNNVKKLTALASIVQSLLEISFLNEADLIAASSTRQQKRLEDRIAVKFPAFDVILNKKQTPHPEVAVVLCGIDLSLPMTDETICRVLAMILAQLLPKYA